MYDTDDWQELGTLRRPAPKPKPTPQQIAAAQQVAAIAEQRRLAAREKIRGQIAQAELAEIQRLEAVASIDAVNAKKDMLASAHCAECAPLQRRLKEIEAIEIANIRARLDGDPAIEIERRTLLADLRDRNAALEASIAHQDSLLRQLEVERLSAAKRCGCSSLQGDLIHTGRPDLLAAMRAAHSAVNWAGARLAKAQESFQRFPGAYTKAELDAANEALARANQESATAIEAVCDE